MCDRVALNFMRRTCHLVTTAAVHAPTLNISSKKRITGLPVTSCHEGINELMKRNTAHVKMNVTQAVRVALAARSQSGATPFVGRLGADMDSQCNVWSSGRLERQRKAVRCLVLFYGILGIPGANIKSSFPLGRRSKYRTPSRWSISC
jgi:hypothetical protein